MPHTFVTSTETTYREITQEEAKKIASSHEAPNYTKKEIQFILDHYHFEYHRVDLPFGMHTQGQDRSKTAALIFREDFLHKTVLDVGTGYGCFAFQAEEKGASVVHATEIKKHRFAGARIISNIKNSQVVFTQEDFMTVDLTYRYDIVLALNILHHLEYPFYGLKRLSDLTLDLLILEFPDLSDPKHPDQGGEVPATDLTKPLVAVGDLTKRDQHFVFNQAAIYRYLVSNQKFFRHIDWLPSPMHSSRHLAFCWK